MKESQLIKYLKKVRDLSEHFKRFEIMHVPKEQYFRANLMSKMAISKKVEFNHAII